MRYRKLDINGDFTFGQGAGNFYVNTPAAVAQAVKTQLGLIEGEWFLDTTLGTPYNSKILGAGHISTYDAAIQEVIMNTQGVTKIIQYSSNYNPSTRQARVSVTLDTLYGSVTLSTNL
jgi:hypothetical protein